MNDLQPKTRSLAPHKYGGNTINHSKEHKNE